MITTGEVGLGGSCWHVRLCGAGTSLGHQQTSPYSAFGKTVLRMSLFGYCDHNSSGAHLLLLRLWGSLTSPRTRAPQPPRTAGSCVSRGTLLQLSALKMLPLLLHSWLVTPSGNRDKDVAWPPVWPPWALLHEEHLQPFSFPPLLHVYFL